MVNGKSSSDLRKEEVPGDVSCEVRNEREEAAFGAACVVLRTAMKDRLRGKKGDRER
jgi:hypothetical protein